jgi:AcrR family transcriptional regulator
MVFAKIGYEAATTNAIAAVARTSIGSLYQFFPNKEAILHALAGRYVADLHEVHEKMLDEKAVKLPLSDLYDRIISLLADFHATRPAFKTLFAGSTASAYLNAAGEQLTRECVDRVDLLMAAREPGLDPARRYLCATINVNVMKAVLPIAQSLEPASRQALLAEMKNLLMGHMESVIKDSRVGKPATGQPKSA